MKKIIAVFAATLLLYSCTDQQLLSTLGTANEVLNGSGASALSTQEITAGLKEALSVGTNNAASLTSKVDGYLKNPKIRVPFPPDAQKVKNTLVDAGFGSMIEDFEVKLNRSAEEAAKSAAPIFLDAIKGMSIQDGLTILKGEDNAATNYLRSKTYQPLYNRFNPEVVKATNKMQIAKHWDPIAKKYNVLTLLTGGEPVNPDLEDFWLGGK